MVIASKTESIDFVSYKLSGTTQNLLNIQDFQPTTSNYGKYFVRFIDIDDYVCKGKKKCNGAGGL